MHGIRSCREEFRAEVRELLEACDTTARAFGERAQMLGEAGEQVAGMAAATAELHEEHSHGFEAIRQTLDRVRETFSRFSFLG